MYHSNTTKKLHSYCKIWQKVNEGVDMCLEVGTCRAWGGAAFIFTWNMEREMDLTF